ncbi:hypothetical protein A3Q56_00488 [Intoshia linei]|uniref:Association with the SNF1 complex (ASC) domain-containing protein n=1 Tax=Intoshia linei TaxID=1819745 RepID=A0A177BBN6_9BILA|nr:hypothetical protein A3Q56_00488 [Intoshia linei]
MGNIHNKDGSQKLFSGSSKKRQSLNVQNTRINSENSRLSASDGLKPFDSRYIAPTVNVTRTKFPTVIKWNNVNATSITISGSFDNWKSYIPLSKSSDNFYTILELTEGQHEFKFNVDGVWKVTDDFKTIKTSEGIINNIINIKSSDCEVFEALALDAEGRATSSSDTPEGEYTREFPSKYKKSFLASPPALPPYLTNPLLNQTVSPSSEPCLLPQPSTVMLNHLYALSIRDNVSNITEYCAQIEIQVRGMLFKQKCTVPIEFQGDWYSNSQGKDYNILLNDKELIEENEFVGRCIDIKTFNTTLKRNYRLYYIHLLFKNVFVFFFIRSSIECSSHSASLDDICSTIYNTTEIFTLFSKTQKTVSCRSTFDGIYRFKYEVDIGGGGICDNPASKLVACQRPGSFYLDNQIFKMHFAPCIQVSTSKNEIVRYECLGSWRDENNDIYFAVADLRREIFRERFHCLVRKNCKPIIQNNWNSFLSPNKPDLGIPWFFVRIKTRDDQERNDNWIRYTMSRWADCSTLKSYFNGDIKLQLLPGVMMNEQRFTATCNLPHNFSGTWFWNTQFDTKVVINSTHIYYKAKIDEFTYRETYYTCLITRDSRYLMTEVTVGRCEINYICFDFLKRHHNIIRWRMGRPLRLRENNELSNYEFMAKKFRESCDWTMFTYDRQNVQWKYNVYFLNPPKPIDCPIAGRYTFIQFGNKEEMIQTRIPGMTPKPRHHTNCKIHESELKVCRDDTKSMLLDADYCMSLDHNAKQIDEYDRVDNKLMCVGYWMEGMKSHLITYDLDDVVSKFRCWIYERTNWRTIVMSRSTRAVCNEIQTSKSRYPNEGASLLLKLHEAERINDECPQVYVDGKNPYESIYQVKSLKGQNMTNV